MTTATDTNGYTNYETWNVALYLDNEYGHYKTLKTAIHRPEFRHNVKALSKWIAVYVRMSGFTCDFKAQRRFTKVNWIEIAQGYIDELDTEDRSVFEVGHNRIYWLNAADFDYQLDNFSDTNVYSQE